MFLPPRQLSIGDQTVTVAGSTARLYRKKIALTPDVGGQRMRLAAVSAAGKIMGC